MAAFSAVKDTIVSSPRLGTTELLFRRSVDMNLQPVWVIPGKLFVVSIGGTETYVNITQSPLNSHASVSLARDKYFTRRVLERNDIPNIPFARPTTHAEADAFLAVHKTIIAKPVSGSGSNDIHIVTKAAQLHSLRIEGYILEKYIAGVEMRYLVVNGEVAGVYRSDYGTSVEVSRALECVAFPRDEWDEALIESSLQIARVMGLSFAAIDFLIDDTGCAHVLEVNTMPDLKWFHAPTSGPAVDAAGLFMEAIVTDGHRLRSTVLIEES